MAEPRAWSLAELTEDAGAATDRFRRSRLNEPLEQYTRFFETFTPIFSDLIDRLPSLTEETDVRNAVAGLVEDDDVRTGFRYLSAPPISEDDLKILAQTTLTASVLRRDAEQAKRIRDVVLHIIDPHRFPWILEEREPTREERRIAVVASAALVAARKVETSRRSGSRMQEEAVRNVLREIDLIEVPRRDIRMLDDAPASGEFCGESILGDTRTDMVIRLHDRRVMAVECKTSNSAVNSFKRINHEAAGKARAWLAQFGDRQIIPCAVIDGVFNPANLETAQGEGLAIVWSHRLADLTEFIEETKSPSYRLRRRDEVTMAKAVVAYDKDLPGIPDRRPWEPPVSHLVKDDDAPTGWREDESGRRPSRLLLTPKIRDAVDAWRDDGYPGASGVTRRLLEYWFAGDHEVPGFDVPFRYYFCQREAIETLIWLVEVAGQRDTKALVEAYGAIVQRDLVSKDIEFQTTMEGKRQLRRYVPELEAEGVQDLPPEDLRRFAFKMATGSGKTWAMAMAVVWSRLHKQHVPGSDLSTNFLVVAPNVIVYQRLEKDFADNRIFHQLPLIPPEWRGGFSQKVILRGEATEPDPSGNLFLTNIHQLYESRDEDWTPENAVEALLGKKPSQDLASSAQRSMLERVKSLKDLVVLNDEAHHVHDDDLAWSKSLLAIHEALPHGLGAWLDFSATPKDQNGMYFPWTVVDYPLAQAVEDRIVKAPIIVTREANRNRPTEDPDGITRDNVAEKYGYWLQAAVRRWKEHRKVYKKLGIRPVLFIMAEKNVYADALGEYLWKTGEFGFRQSEVLVIHTDKAGEITKGDLEKARQAARDIDGAESTIKVIVSVMMLREGWDVRNVTVVLGLRPFTAKAEILPEQVIGRGLRLMTQVSPDRTQTLEVLGTRNLLNVLREQLEAEGVGVASTNTNPPPPIIIEPVKERLKYDIAIPITKPSLKHDHRKLSDLDVQSLEPIFEQEELDERFRIRLMLEFATTETEVHQDDIAGGLLPIQELLADMTNLVAGKAGLTNRFAELYPVIREYVGSRCFGREIDPDDDAPRSHLARLEIREGIAKYLVRKIADLTIERREIEFDKQDFRLSETKPFSWRRNLPPLEAEKTVFNFVATYNDFERRFAEFMDNANDVLRFAALGTTEQGASGTLFRVDYLKPSGAIGFYYPDWVAVQRELDGQIIHWIVETKGRVWEGTAEKDAAMQEWCRRIARATGDTWKYIRVNQADFHPDFATFRQLVVTLVVKAMTRKRDESGATMSHEEFIQARDEGRA